MRHSSDPRSLLSVPILVLLLVAAVACGETGDDASTDPGPRTEVELDALAPKTTGEDSPIRQLHTVTLCTADVDSAAAFYRDGMGLEMTGPVEIADEARETQRVLWGIPEEIGWDLYILERPSVPGTIQVRLIVVDRETDLIHSTWDGREPGPFSMGFPTEELIPWDEELRGMGVDSMMPLSQYKVPRADGTMYGIHETIFKAPDFVHAVGISRRDGMPQLGPTDPSTGRGGPVYSAQMIQDSEGVLDFYTGTLGLELRSDRQFKSSGSKGALGVPDGTVFRFAIVYAEGARFGHLLFVDYDDEMWLPSTGVAPRLPNRGLVMWSFPVRDVEEMRARLEADGRQIVAGPREYESPSLGRHKVMTVLDPTGFMVELFEPAE